MKACRQTMQVIPVASKRPERVFYLIAVRTPADEEDRKQRDHQNGADQPQLLRNTAKINPCGRPKIEQLLLPSIKLRPLNRRADGNER